MIDNTTHLMKLKNFKGAIAIYKYGSSTYPFITNPEDVDYLVIYRTEQEANNAYERDCIIRDIYPKLHFFSIALETLESGKYLKLHQAKYADHEQYKWSYRFFRTSIAPLALVLLHWAKWLEGERIDFIKYTELTDDFLGTIKRGLSSILYTITDAIDYDGKPLKNWYYLLIAFFVYYDKSYNLTVHEGELINKAHNKEFSFAELQSITAQLEYL